MKHLNIMGVYWKIRFSAGMGVTKIQYIGVDCLRGEGAWTVCKCKRDLWERRGGDFDGGLIFQCNYGEENSLNIPGWFAAIPGWDCTPAERFPTRKLSEVAVFYAYKSFWFVSLNLFLCRHLETSKFRWFNKLAPVYSIMEKFFI